ncbi:hypothetical protein IBX65_05705 [Candidatus Aerophobetes bacterium]|nr:hypothetical protein [Candidatus Aerophobetes bacterium]
MKQKLKALVSSFLTVRNLKKPSVCFFDWGVEEGILCAVAESAEEQGREAGKMVLEILAGKKAQDIPVVTGHQEISMVNLETAQKLELDIPDALLHLIERIIQGFSIDPQRWT